MIITGDISLAELIRRGMELLAMTCPEVKATALPWTMPVLRGSGGNLIDPGSAKVAWSQIVQEHQAVLFPVVDCWLTKMRVAT